MSDLFLKVVNVSISASWLVLAVIALRFLLKKVPKWITVLLWGIVAVRLLLPFSIESVLSMVPSSETISPHIAVDAPSIIYTSTPIINTGIPIINNAINPIVIQGNTPAPGDSVNPLQVKLAIAANIWLLGVLVMTLLAGISYWRLRRRVASAVRLRDRIYRSEFVDSPFVLGIFRPKIYLPYDLEESALSHVIAHEQTHIRRKDHWWKPLGFLLLSIHWMNPMMWVGYILLCRDIELACDEKVVKKLEPAQKADYSQALLSCSVSRKTIAICPLAFGEVGVKQRVKNVLNYKKPAFWVVLTGIIVCIVVAVCFLTDPKEEKALATGVEYYPDFFYFQNPLVDVDYDALLSFTFLVNEDQELMVMENPESGKWATIGKLKEIELSTISLLKLFSTKIKHFNSVSKTWRSEVNPGQQGLVYYLFEMKDGRQYLACGESKHESPKHAIHWIVGLKEEMPQKQSQNTAESSENSIQEVTLPEYPGITFFSDGENTVAIDEDHNPVIIDAEPLSFVLFADLTGDGNEELCVSYSFGS